MGYDGQHAIEQTLPRTGFFLIPWKRHAAFLPRHILWRPWTHISCRSWFDHHPFKRTVPCNKLVSRRNSPCLLCWACEGVDGHLEVGGVSMPHMSTSEYGNLGVNPPPPPQHKEEALVHWRNVMQAWYIANVKGKCSLFPCCMITYRTQFCTVWGLIQHTFQGVDPPKGTIK